MLLLAYYARTGIIGATLAVCSSNNDNSSSKHVMLISNQQDVPMHGGSI